MVARDRIELPTQRIFSPGDFGELLGAMPGQFHLLLKWREVSLSRAREEMLRRLVRKTRKKRAIEARIVESAIWSDGQGLPCLVPSVRLASRI
jgi:hypothetical protein